MNKGLQKGQLLLELVLTIGLAALIIPGLLTALVATRDGKPQLEQRVQATALLKETEAAVKNVRDDDWTTFANLNTGVSYHPVIASNRWTLASGTASNAAGFTQDVVLSDVYRDSSGAITSDPGGTLDPSTIKADIAISWGSPLTSVINSTIFLTRTGNLSYAHTTQAHFNAGTLINAQVTNDSGGEIKIANNNKAKWCSPSFAKDANGVDVAIDLPDGPPVAVAASASATVDIPNDVFVAVAPTATTSTKLAYASVTANTTNPIATLRGTFTMDSAKYSSGTFPAGTGLTNTFKTNDVKYYKSSGGKTYALLATDLPDKEIVVVQVNDGTGDSFQDPVNKIYKYWTYFNTRIYNTSAGLDTGFYNPSANTADTSSAGDNNGFQSNPTRVYSDNNSFAVDTDSGSNTGTNCTGTDKDKHRFYNYGISVPSGASINGIEVRLDARVDSTSGSPKHCVQLSWDGGNTWTTAKSTSTLTTSEATYTLGGSGDNWGRTWSTSNLTNTNFRVRVANVASSTSRDFSLDWAAVRVHYSGTSSSNDQAPFDYGARSIAVLGSNGYVASGGFLYTFDLSNIDSKSPTAELDQVGCRIQLDGFDCRPGTPASDVKYSAGETGTTWSTTGSPAHNDCSDGGNIELNANNHITGVQANGRNYIYVAVGAGTDKELDIVDVTNVPGPASSPAINAPACGTSSSGNAGWKVTGSLDFNSQQGTEEAANSVFVKSDGSRAYMSSNGGIDKGGPGGDPDGVPDSKQFYIINTTNKSAPSFLSGLPGSPDYGPLTGFYYGTGANAQLYPRRSLTVLNGDRAILVGSDGTTDGNNAEEYQVLNTEVENTPTYCSGLDFVDGFNDLTSVSEADYENYVYMIANNKVNELKIIQGGPDNAIYLPSGTFESQPFDSASVEPGTILRTFNRLLANVIQPASTFIKVQVAVRGHASSGSCPTDPAEYKYVGPGGDSNAYFTPSSSIIDGAIPFGTYLSNAYVNPQRCFRYKVLLESPTDQRLTPVLQDITWNYSQ